MKVTVETAGGETVVTDHSTVTLTLGSGTGTLGGTLTATAVNGIATFSNLSLTKTGSFTLKATDGTLTAATSNSFTITPATASKLVFAGTPATELAGKAISPAVVVDIEDTFGNIVTTSSASVAMTIATGGSTLTGTTSVAAKAGVATFSNLVLTKLGKYTLKAAASAVTAATSGSFSVIPGVATKLVLVKSPTSATAGKAISPALVIDVEDAFGNIVTTNTSTVKFTATGGSALTGTSSVAAKAGVATFSNLILDKAAKYTLESHRRHADRCDDGQLHCRPRHGEQTGPREISDDRHRRQGDQPCARRRHRRRVRQHRHNQHINREIHRHRRQRPPWHQFRRRQSRRRHVLQSHPG